MASCFHQNYFKLFCISFIILRPSFDFLGMFVVFMLSVHLAQSLSFQPCILSFKPAGKATIKEYKRATGSLKELCQVANGEHHTVIALCTWNGRVKVPVTLKWYRLHLFYLNAETEGVSVEKWGMWLERVTRIHNYCILKINRLFIQQQFEPPIWQ